MSFTARTYPDIVRDLLTVMTGGTVAETHSIGAEVPEMLHLEQRPVARVSHLQGTIELGEDRVDYRFTERDFELVGEDDSPDELVAIRFRDRAPRPAPQSSLTVNYYPERLRPTPLTDVNVGGVARTLIETTAREMATQYQQLERIYRSAFVETAEGSGLEKVAALVDTRRLRRGHPVGKVRFSRRSGSPGAIFIPIATAVSDGEGKRYRTSHAATLLPQQATVEVWVHGESQRTEPVEAGKLTVLERAIAGVDRVSNDEDTYLATEEETDGQLASRARRAIHATGKGTRDAIRFGLEGLPFVSAVSLAEYPDPAVPLPGILRLDVALSEDNAFHRRLVDRRLTELRPAGIYIDRQWAGSVELGFQVDLVLAGASLPTSELADVKDGISERFATHVRGLAPGAVLRKARLSALVLEDERAVDATLAVTADGSPVSEDSWTLPTGKAAALAGGTGVSFGSVRFEDEADTGQLLQTRVDADLAITDLTTDLDSLRTQVTSALETLLAPLSPGATVSFDQLAAAVRDDEKFVLRRAASVVTFDREDGGFTELRDGDPPFTVPTDSALVMGEVVLTEESP